ncbi:multidrug effflux MFS transporter [Acidocella sp.]|uniref:multidrug effflux MFS transporter n=1 Tax=Acidocella sp. TaxID=50710 RepID=UPI0026387F8D|nr:multidrug effflux MFS transporter [Acidocella sp.]
MPPAPDPHKGLSFFAFVTAIASIQAVEAMSIDMMVPALGKIAGALHVAAGNERQWVITSFVLAFGAAQLLYGLAADRFGRRPVLIFALAVFTLCSFAAALAPSFALLLLARAGQGFGAAGAQVLSVSVVRDCYAGRQMARVMSLSFMVFLTAPIIAPSLGQGLLLLAPWPAIFAFLGIYGGLITLWVAWRLPETQHAEDHTGMNARAFAAAIRLTLANRMSLGYTLAAMLLLGAWLGFINSAQQVFAEVFHVPKLFPLIFAACSVCMAAAALLNARLVDRLGMRRLAHTAMLGFIAMAMLQAGAAISGHDTLLTFTLIQAAMMFSFGLLAGNCGAISMEPLGHIAGTAAAVQGFINMLGAALIGIYIGQSFNGTLVPLAIGFAACGILALITVTAAEGGTLFRSQVAVR